MKSRIVIGAALTMIAVMPAARAATDLAIRSGDQIVFLGDKVTEEYVAPSRADEVCYPTLVESFLVVRYPDVQASYYNLAMAGATAEDTLARLGRDVLPLKPTVAVVCLGLQEAGMRAFDAALLDAHKASMTKLVDALKTAGCRVYVMSPPSIDEQSPASAGLREADYNGTLAKYAAAQREIASAKGATFVDWYGESVAARAKAPRPASGFLFSSDGLRHTLRSQALAASLVLAAFKAEPINVEITMDWKAGTIACDAGEASLTVGPDGSRQVKVARLPLPWPTLVGQSQMLGLDWEAAKWCRFMLKVTNTPSPGVLISSGDRQVPMLQQQLTEGLNMVTVEPLRSLQAAQDLSNLIRRKNYTRLHAWRDQELQPIKEPELADAQKALVAAWYKYFAGYEKILARTPKVFDLTVTIAELNLPSPTTRPAGAEGARPALSAPKPAEN